MANHGSTCHWKTTKPQEPAWRCYRLHRRRPGPLLRPTERDMTNRSCRRVPWSLPASAAPFGFSSSLPYRQDRAALRFPTNNVEPHDGRP